MIRTEQRGLNHVKPSVKQELAAVRMHFDWLVVGQVVPTNPAHSVRGPKHIVKRGKTPVLTREETRELLCRVISGRWSVGHGERTDHCAPTTAH